MSTRNIAKAMLVLMVALMLAGEVVINVANPYSYSSDV